MQLKEMVVVFSFFKSKNKKQYEQVSESNTYADYEKRLWIEVLKMDERLARSIAEKETREENLRIDKMRRKIKIHELEKKMKEYGIDED